jgi:hypothetical protein
MNPNSSKGAKMDKFWQLMKESVIVQGLITLMVLGAWLYLVVSLVPIPPSLELIVGTVIGFYFGGKSQLAISNYKKEVR